MSELDKYDLEIERLINLPGSSTEAAWLDGALLFQFASPSGDVGQCPNGQKCGCLTMIRNAANSASKFAAWTHSLTMEIASDERIPLSVTNLIDGWSVLSPDQRRDKLQPFAEWQRRLDKEIRNERASV
jgi:hypothetical protein